MNAQEAYELIYQLARATPVNGDIGDKREEALEVIRKLIADAEKTPDIDTKS